MSTSIVKVITFASIRDNFCEDESFDTVVKSSYPSPKELIDDVIQILHTRFEERRKTNQVPSAEKALPIDKQCLMISINEEFVAQSISLKNGDRVGLIPPVSGG